MIVATNNNAKLTEIKEILKDYKLECLKDRKIEIDVLEDQDSFKKNALKKAREIYEIVKEPTIADDSGLCIKALNGFPGIKTHRFLGNQKTEQEKNEYLLNEVNKYSDRSAQVICCIVYCDKERVITTEGIIKGQIATEKRGDNGFGFDEIFELENGKTLAELTSKKKNEISARKIALEKLKEELAKIEG